MTGCEKFELFSTLAHSPRTGWVQRGVQNPESIAEHIYGCWLLGTFLLPDTHPDPTYDKQVILDMLLLHDLPEAVTGDIPRPEKKKNPLYYEQLEQQAAQSSLLSGFAATLEAIAGIHVDIPDNIATRQDVQTATEAILAALAQIQPDDPYSQALAAFFGITDAYNPQLVPITEQEIIDELSQIWEDEFGTPADPLPAES